MQEHPFQFARKISTLDHASRGRIAWNIVTNGLPNGARNFGLPSLTPHDERYRWAEEYMKVVYKLWEGSWDDDALLQNRASGRHGDSTKVHRINHVGEYYQVEGPHLCAPSPQRTPLLFQAGSSRTGMRFAARHAEAQFLITPTPAIAQGVIQQTRTLMQEYGRAPEDIKFFQGLSFVIGSTEEEVARKNRALDEALDYEAMIAHLGGVMDIDLDHGSLDDSISALQTEGAQSLLDWVRAAVPEREPTVGDIGVLAGRASRISGTPEQIADRLAVWQAIGIDGINVVNATIPGSYREFIAHVMPVLQARGLARRDFTSGTLRQRLCGRDRLAPPHPAARYRGMFHS